MSAITKTLHKLLVPVLATVALAFAIYNVWGAQQDPPPKAPFAPPAQSPYERGVAGSGITEARTENIAIGAPVPGLVAEVFVKVGDEVYPNDRLFRLDDRALKADLGVRQAKLAAAEAQLARLKNMPRPEEVKPAQIKVAEAQAKLVEAEDRYRRFERLSQRQVTTEEELVQARQQHEMAREQANWAQAQYDLLMAGAWSEDVKIAATAVAESRAQVQQIETDLARLDVTAPTAIDVQKFKVLQVNVRPGEFVGAPATQPLIVLGDIDQLHVRVDIDEYDITRFNPAAPAVAKLRGESEVEFNLQFVRIDPYVIPKRSLTGDNTERVDTRVLQVIYALEPANRPLYVGQQVDVFIKAN